VPTLSSLAGLHHPKMANRFNDYWLRIRELRTLVEHLDADDRSFVLNPPSDPANDGSDDLIEIQDGNTVLSFASPFCFKTLTPPAYPCPWLEPLGRAGPPVYYHQH
jgi:hypothetical protein